MSEQRVWIAQCLCPERHAILAASAEAASKSAANDAVTRPLRAAVERMLRVGAMNPWCGICRAGSDTWRYEVERTRFRTMEEATPHLQQSEAEQAVTRALLQR